ncbi:MAG: VWA domain-containing protein [Mariprofundales bacterium]|nr:VWA domain-containing protein [Mariprofundales bacterium]
MIQLGWPWMLAALPLPLLVYWLAPAAKNGGESALQVPFGSDFRQAGAGQGGHANARGWKRKLLLATMVLAWLLLVLAAARPQWLGDPVALPVKGRDLMLAVDLSGSMQIRDFVRNGHAVDRLTITKEVATDFIQRRKGDRIGLILFGSQAYIQTPLTFDHATVEQLLAESAIGLAGKSTAIGDAIGLAVKHLSADGSDGAKDRVLILLTDGVNTAGTLSPTQAANLAKNAGVRIYTIGIGADSMVQQTLFGSQRVNPSADLDEKMLTTIANKTGGHFFRAKNSQQLTQIYHDIDAIEPVAHDAQFFRPVRELFIYPLVMALSLVFGMMLIRELLSNSS